MKGKASVDGETRKRRSSTEARALAYGMRRSMRLSKRLGFEGAGYTPEAFVLRLRLRLAAR